MQNLLTVFRRAIMVKRAVRVNSQLKSHKRFASAFPRYVELVDNARLYCTNAIGGPPRVNPHTKQNKTISSNLVPK